MTEDMKIPASIFGLKTLDERMVKMPCYLGGEMSLWHYNDMVTYYVQSYIQFEEYKKCQESTSKKHHQ